MGALNASSADYYYYYGGADYLQDWKLRVFESGTKERSGKG